MRLVLAAAIKNLNPAKELSFDNQVVSVSGVQTAAGKQNLFLA
jgi:hypothetical protein